ncbi:hypothetical protein NQZ68_034465 [Dissostichus eleginoides]|nr:hypothetical protein NQZ68_034465 [Dissostichus eleginoides]
MQVKHSPAHLSRGTGEGDVMLWGVESFTLECGSQFLKDNIPQLPAQRVPEQGRALTLGRHSAEIRDRGHNMSSHGGGKAKAAKKKQQQKIMPFVASCQQQKK